MRTGPGHSGVWECWGAGRGTGWGEQGGVQPWGLNGVERRDQSGEEGLGPQLRLWGGDTASSGAHPRARV